MTLQENRIYFNTKEIALQSLSTEVKQGHQIVEVIFQCRYCFIVAFKRHSELWIDIHRSHWQYTSHHLQQICTAWKPIHIKSQKSLQNTGVVKWSWSSTSLSNSIHWSLRIDMWYASNRIIYTVTSRGVHLLWSLTLVVSAQCTMQPGQPS